MTNTHYLFEGSKHLEDINFVESYEKILQNNIKENPSIADKLKGQMDNYGISQYSSYNMEFTMYIVHYVMLKDYLLHADKIIDLTYYKFTYLGVEYTQIELINKALEILKEALEFDHYDYGNLTEEEFKEKTEYFSTTYDIIKMLSPFLSY